MLAAGVDGCRAGWICVTRERVGGSVGWQRFGTAEALLAQAPRPAVLAIDIPIGLMEQGFRHCDRQARSLLGPRKSSVFSAPLRAVLEARSWEEACSIRQRIEGKRMSKQAWAIVAKIREVDRLLRKDPKAMPWVREVHPEVSFCAWSGAPLPYPKKKKPGRNLRRKLVEKHFGRAAIRSVRDSYLKKDVADDDILDAFAALWTAERILHGEESTLPGQPPLDSCGLRMEIVY